MTKKTVLIVGSGSREHALAWKLRQSPEVGALLVAPGNAGTGHDAENVAIAPTDLDGIVRCVEERDVALTVVGPEAPLALGLADRLRALGRRVVGPNAAAARIEASKSFAKDLMAATGVPTATYAVFDRWEDAEGYLLHASYPLVVKADGLAAGKGVSVCSGYEEARDAVRTMMVGGLYGASGNRVVVEEALSGPEISLIALVDGEHVLPLPLAQDHKRLGDGDTGPNTGGMGAYAPVPFLTDAERDALSRRVLKPVVAELASRGTPYRGVLFAGLMLTESGPHVLEYNCRFGDPEAQVILPLLADDLFSWLEAVADGTLSGQIPVLDKSAVGVVLAAPGYPERPATGAEIHGLPSPSSEEGSAGGASDVLIFHAGTVLDGDGRIITAGGRVLTVVGIGDTVEKAAERAYDSPVQFEGMQRRGDIAWQARHPHPLSPSPTEQERGNIHHVASRHHPSAEQERGDTYDRSWTNLPSAMHGRGAGGKGTQSRIGVLVSGGGSNLQALIDACRGGGLDADVAVVVSHRKGALALERAEMAGIPAFALSPRSWRDHEARLEYEERLLDLLAPFDLDLIVLAGWMFVLSNRFLDRCPCPIVNVHPALLPMGGSGEVDETLDPDLPIIRGAHAVRDAIDLGLPYTGVSVHHVTSQVDAGPVVAREIIRIDPNDDEESLYQRVKMTEHQLLPYAVRVVLSTVHAGGVYA